MVFVWILIPVGLAVGSYVFLAYRNRKPNSLEAGMRDFRRGLDALDPANDPLKRSQSDGRKSFDPDRLDPNGPRGKRPTRRR